MFHYKHQKFQYFRGFNMRRRSFLKKSSAVAGASAAAVSFPHVVTAKPKFKVKMATTWLKNAPGFGTGANYLAKKIEELSGRRIRVKVYGDKEIVPALQVFDAVQRGTVDMGHGVSYYWQGKIASAPFFAAIPFGFTASEMNAWLEFGGGHDLWKEVYDPFGVIPFSAGNTGVQMGGWFNKPIETVKDFKGLKIRMPGLGGKVLSQLNAAVVTLPGSEIFQALKGGTIDATEWVGPYNDLASGFYKAAKFYYWPGWHEPGANLEFLVNKKFYNSLPKDLQQVVQVAAKAANNRMISEYLSRNAPALNTLVTKHKVQLKKFPDPVLKKLKNVSKEVVADAAKKDKLSQKVYQSMMKFEKDILSWQKVSEIAYGKSRI